MENEQLGEPRILVVDLETTSLDALLGGIVEIGACWLMGGVGEFSMKCRPRPGSAFEAKAIGINGCDWLEDPTVAPQLEAVEAFLDWVGPGPVMLAGMNPKHDLGFLREAVDSYRVKRGFPFSHRSLDLHTLAVTFALAAGEPVPDKGLNTDEVYALVSMPEEPKPHRALVGAKMEAEAFRIFMGAGLATAPVPFELVAVDAASVVLDEAPDSDL